jgi:hypothetical protein
MLWLQIICLKFRSALHKYFPTSFNYLNSQNRKIMTETVPTSMDLHGNIGQRSTMPKTYRHKHDHSDTAVSEELAQIVLVSVCKRLCLCACVLSIYTQNLAVYNQPYKIVITVAYTSRRPTSWSRDSLTNNSSEVHKILLFLRY